MPSSSVDFKQRVYCQKLRQKHEQADQRGVVTRRLHMYMCNLVHTFEISCFARIITHGGGTLETSEPDRSGRARWRWKHMQDGSCSPIRT